MPSQSRKHGLPARPLTALPETGLPVLKADDAAMRPDASLSAAFKNVLGVRPGEDHLPIQQGGKMVAKQVKRGEVNASLKTSPRPPHIGPRSGHK